MYDRSNIFRDIAEDIDVQKLPGLWQVPEDTFPDVVETPRTLAPRLYTLRQCAFVSGTKQSIYGASWVRVEGAEERWVSLDSFPLMRMVFTVVSKEGQSCHDLGLFAVRNADHCELAVSGMGLIDRRVYSTTEQALPEGCFVHNTSVAMLNENPKSAGNPNNRYSQLICSNLEPCVAGSSTTTTFTSTTSITTVTTATSLTSTSTTTFTKTSTTGTYLYPSLFCFAVAEADSYETGLLRYARMLRTGIYGCDDHMTLTDDEIDVGTKDDPEVTYPVGSLKCEKGSWGSWDNAKVFLKAWRAVTHDARYAKHDWVVKLDADTVFHASRLKDHVRDVPAPTDKSFFQNYLDGYPVVGAIEVASKAAIVELSARIDECERIAYGAEDDWFVKCMRSMGAWQRRDDELLQHEQHPDGNMCPNPRFVAMHPYKEKDAYKRCLAQGASVEDEQGLDGGLETGSPTNTSTSTSTEDEWEVKVWDVSDDDNNHKVHDWTYG